MAYYHRKHDPQFAEQWDQAREYGIDLLHGRVWQRALEGDLEPVYHMGVRVGYIRKFSDKLQIELLRAYRPERFNTPGAQVNVGVKNDVFVLTEEQRHELQRINRRRIERECAQRTAEAEEITKRDSRNSPGPSDLPALPLDQPAARDSLG